MTTKKTRKPARQTAAKQQKPKARPSRAESRKTRGATTKTSTKAANKQAARKTTKTAAKPKTKSKAKPKIKSKIKPRTGPKTKVTNKTTSKPTRKPAAKRAKAPAAKTPVAKAPAVKAPATRAIHHELLRTILAHLNEEKAANTVQIDLHNKSTIADFMVITSGRSQRHVNAITEHLVDMLHRNGLARVRVEGLPQCDWVLIDAGDVIVHVFRPEVRAFYNLEKMWAHARPER